MKSKLPQLSLTHTIICKENSYGATEAAADKILSQARKYATQGAIYALRKDNTFMLINEHGDGAEYVKNGFDVLRKE